MSNFDFLQKTDNDLFKIIQDAEKLYRDEYFEQAIVQTRRYAEIICRNLAGESVSSETTFDECLAFLNDSFTKNIRQREMISDLYFLKAQGNASAHGKKVKQDGNIALDCIKRAFELGINYSVMMGGDKKNEKIEFSEEVLVMGEKKKKGALKEKYLAKKKTAKKNNQLYKTKKEEVKKYVYPSLIENPKSASKISFIGGLILLLAILGYLYIIFS